MTEQTIPSVKLFREHPWHFRAWVNEQVELTGGQAVELFHYPARHQRVNLRLSNVCETGAHQYCQGANLANPVIGADWRCHCLCHWASAPEREAYRAEREGQREWETSMPVSFEPDGITIRRRSDGLVAQFGPGHDRLTEWRKLY